MRIYIHTHKHTHTDTERKRERERERRECVIYKEIKLIVDSSKYMQAGGVGCLEVSQRSNRAS
jgi:hypothetical protein